MAESGRIFICYRREETAYSAGWLFDRLAARFGGQIFKDVDSIEPGDDWVEVITRVVGSCDVLLALIGDRWLTITDEDGRRRLDDPHDFVLLEIEAALTRNVRVIPILVEGARMPRAAELPPSLARLTRRQALVLSPADFDTSRLVEVLDKTLAEVRSAQEDAAALSAPTVKAPDREATELSEAPEQRKTDESSPVPSVPPAAPATEPEVLRDSPRVSEPISELPPTSDATTGAPGPEGHGPPAAARDMPRASVRLRVAAIVGVILGLAAAVALVRLFVSSSSADSSANSATGSSPTHSSSGTTTGPLPDLPRSAAPLSNDQMVVALETSGGGTDLYLVNAAHPELQPRLIAGGKYDQSLPSLSPDRRTVIYPQFGTGVASMWAIKATGGGAKRVLSQCIDRPAWSPDATRLAVACKGTPPRLGIVDLRTNAFTPLPSGRMTDIQDLTWSPDGTSVVFAGETRDRQGLFSVPVDGGSPPTQLTTQADKDPAWHRFRNEDLLAFRRKVGDNVANIMVMNLAGGQVPCATQTFTEDGHTLCQVTDTSTFAQDPSWSSNGKQIAFKDGVSNADIKVVNAEGGVPVSVLPETHESPKAPAWSTR